MKIVEIIFKYKNLNISGPSHAKDGKESRN